MTAVDAILNNEDGEYITQEGLMLYRRSDGYWTTTCGLVPHSPDQMRALIEHESV